jgi:cell envelope opacity-associated protein A
MGETDDARTLISDMNHPKEQVYAEYANEMKSLANKARMEMLHTENLKRNPSAAKTYAPEVMELKSALRLAEMNAPRERRALALANSRAKAKIESDPSLKKDEIRKIKNREVLKAREEVGAERYEIKISDRQWEAIQAGAISDTTLAKILNRANPDRVRELATPRATKELSTGKIARIQALKASGYTNEQIASAVGCSASTVRKYL